jgi:DNA topoisomerase 2-associated protein PAT1
MFDHLFKSLSVDFNSLFPSTRIAMHTHADQIAGTSQIDELDRPIWQFLATLAAHSSPEQHQILVASLREKVLDNVMRAKKGWVADEQERLHKLENVDVFLSAFGLHSSQITM